MVKSWFPYTRSRANVIEQKSHPGAVTLEDWGPRSCDPQELRSHSREGLPRLLWEHSPAGSGAETLGRDTRI